MDDEGLIHDFIVESRESLDVVDSDLVRLEQNPRDIGTLNSIFRAVHTIKGTCGFLGLSQLEAVSHSGETLLDDLRSGKRKINDRIAGALLTMVDLFRHILSQVESTGAEPRVDLEGWRETIRLATDEPAVGSTGGADPLEIAFLEAQKAYVETSAPISGDSSDNQNQPPNVHDDSEDAHAIVSTTDRSQPSSAERGNGASSDTTLRVDVSLLDSVMNLVGELVLTRNQILQLTKKGYDAEFARVSQRLNHLTTELQERIMKTRMQSIGNILSKFPRVVRDTAKACGKLVKLDLSGKETELDKSIIEAIKDPLTHLLRNSVDHGIESPDIRKKMGKPEEGTVAVNAFHEGGFVIIDIADDGGGVPLRRISAKAIERGLITSAAAERMSGHEIRQLIFAPGFSTAEKVTNISGRGVGMDVVRSNIERIGGSVELMSVEGQGTTVRIKIPLTLAIVPALLIRADTSWVAIPQVSLVELVRVESECISAEILQLNGSYFYRLRGKLLPLVSLERLFRPGCIDECPGYQGVCNIVVVKAESTLYGITVTEVADTEEIVVKPLSKILSNIPIFGGSTILGDGTIALILDPVGLAKQARVLEASASAHTSEREREHDSKHQDTKSWLVVDSEGREAAFPLAKVNRLEKFSGEAIEFTQDTAVVQYRNRLLRLISLGCDLTKDTIKVECIYSVVVVGDTDESMIGFVVEQITDIKESDAEQALPGRLPNRLGSMVLGGRVVELIDVDSYRAEL